MIDQLSLFDNGAGHTAPRRWLGTGEHNGELICEGPLVRVCQEGDRIRLKAKVVDYEKGHDKWMLQPGAWAGGWEKDWKEIEG